MDRSFSGRVSRDWSGSTSSSGAEFTGNPRGGAPPDFDCVGGGPIHNFGAARPSGPVPSGAPKRSSDEAGFQHSGGGMADDHSAGLRSFKRLRIDGARASLDAVTSTTASLSSTCGSVSPPLHPVSSLARAASEHAARPVPDRMYQQHRFGAPPSGNFGGAPVPPPHPSEVTFRPLTSDGLGGPAASLSRSVSSDSAAFQQQNQHQRQHQVQHHVRGDARDYAGINHMLGDLHALRQRRMELSRRGQEQVKLSDRGVESAQSSNGLGEGGAGMRSFSAGDSPFDGRDFNGMNRTRVIPQPQPQPSRHQQQPQPQQGLNQQQHLPPPPPRWRRSVRLPTSSQLY